MQGISERCGILTFSLRNSKIFDSTLDNFEVFNEQIGESRFMLRRDAHFNLEFTHWSTTTGRRVARVSLRDLAVGRFDVVLTWSNRANDIFVGDFANLPLRHAQARGGKIRKGKNGAVHQIGDDGVKMAYYRVQNGNQVFIPAAKELWDLVVLKVSNLVSGIKACKEIENCTVKDDFLFETSLSQQALVMLVRGFEVYSKNRFVEMGTELEKQAKSPRIDLLLSRFAKRQKPRDEVRSYAQEGGISILESMVRVPRRSGQKGVINFQNWDDCKRAYSLGYNIQFGKIPDLRSDILQRIQQYIKWRHKIMHASEDTTVLNFENVPQEEPVFANFALVERATKDFTEFIEKLHAQTNKTSSLLIND